MQNHLKDELQHILSGTCKVSYGGAIQQPPVTLEMARKQVKMLKETSTSKNKKQRG
jgi:hypothetical protein